MVLRRKAGDLTERCGDAPAVALSRVALVAKQCHGAGELTGELLQERLLGGEVPIEVAEEALKAAIVAQPVPDGSR